MERWGNGQGKRHVTHGSPAVGLRTSQRSRDGGRVNDGMDLAWHALAVLYIRPTPNARRSRDTLLHTLVVVDLSELYVRVYPPPARQRILPAFLSLCSTRLSLTSGPTPLWVACPLAACHVAPVFFCLAATARAQ